MELTQEQLAGLIAKVVANISTKFAADGRNVNEVTADDILIELSETIGNSDGSVAQAESSATDEHGELAENVTDDDKNTDSSVADNVDSGNKSADPTSVLINKVLETLTNFKSAESTAKSSSMEHKSVQRTGEQQRKYASLFIPNGATRNFGAEGFKARIEKMSESERRKTTYGMFGRAVKCIHTANGDADKAAFTAEHKFDDTEMAREFKALSLTSPTDGGYLVPEIYANEIIELLYPATIIYSLGARRLGMANGNLNIPKIKTGSRAMFTGELRAIPKTAPRFGNLKLSAKKLTALIPMSNDLLRSTNFDNDVIVGQDITKQMALGVDWGALMGTGGEFQPLGIMKNKNVQNIDVTTLGADYADANGVLTAGFPNYLVAMVLKNNVYAEGLGFAFNTSVEQFFKGMRDQHGNFIFAREMNENNTLIGYPYRTTNLIETKDGKSSIIFGNWNDLIIGEQGALEIETSREGAWTDDAGHLISAFENDQTLIRAIDNVDIGLRHEESFAVATKVAVPV